MFTDQIIEKVGGFNRFQGILMAVVFGPKILVAWGMLLMSFAGTTPDWWCVPFQAESEDISHHRNNVTSELCLPAGNASSCTFVYNTDKNTIINEWDLVCDKSKTAALITSIQMGGVLLGAFFGGQSADVIGRKLTFFISLLLQGSFNLIAAFSVSWQMFAVLRFLIGSMIGTQLVVSYPYLMEFLTPIWRPICSAVPFWGTGTCLMALACWLRPDWSQQHIILAAIHIPFLFGWFIAPESLRFLAVKDRINEAEKVVDQMCRYNKREKPANTRALLEKVGEEEKKLRHSSGKYTYVDIYRSWSICWKTLDIQLVWMLMSLVYYGISFGAGKLSGNLYLNIFLLSAVEWPATISSFFLNNKIGRRWTSFSFFAIAVIASFGVVIVTRVVAKEEQGVIINVLALLSKLGVGAGWGSFQVITSETYPTVIRNLGYGGANTAARVGGIIAPYVFAMEGDDIMIPFIIVGASMVVCGIMSLLLRETNGKPLAESIGGNVSLEVKKQVPYGKTAGSGDGLSDSKAKKMTDIDSKDIFHTYL